MILALLGSTTTSAWGYSFCCWKTLPITTLTTTTKSIPLRLQRRFLHLLLVRRQQRFDHHNEVHTHTRTRGYSISRRIRPFLRNDRHQNAAAFYSVQSSSLCEKDTTLALGNHTFVHEEEEKEEDDEELLVSQVAGNLRIIQHAAWQQQQTQTQTQTMTSSLFPRSSGSPPSFYLPSPSSSSSPPPLHYHTVYLLGVSGGSDSVALFHVMRSLLTHQPPPTPSPPCSFSSTSSSSSSSISSSNDNLSSPNASSLHVIHFDHEQRGNQSRDDANFVRALGRTYHIPVHMVRWSDHHHHHHHHHNSSTTFSQTHARAWRRRVTQRLLHQLMMQEEELQRQPQRQPPPPMIPAVIGVALTAHHLDDSNESLLLKLLRGTHLTNLQGMALVSSASVDDDDEEEEEEKHKEDKKHAMVWGRPFLTVPKERIRNYLQCRNWTWREDDSNTSNKYLRNRIRNELIPLLTDLVVHNSSEKKKKKKKSSSSDNNNNNNEKAVVVLQKRLDHLAQQSRELGEYLSTQANVYLDASAANTYSSSMKEIKHIPTNEFPIPQTWDSVTQHALYTWIRRSMVVSMPVLSSSSSFLISFEQIQRIIDQVTAYPNSRMWKLDLGKYWTIVRVGGVLRLESCLQDRTEVSTTTHVQEEDLMWSLNGEDVTLASADTTTTHLTYLILHVPRAFIESETLPMQLVSTIATSQHLPLPFHPPWRPECSKMSLKDFLRGQKVPLHQRHTSPVICLRLPETSNGSDDRVYDAPTRLPLEHPPCPRAHLAAVYLISKCKWIVDGRWAFPTSGTSPIRVKLPAPY